MRASTSQKKITEFLRSERRSLVRYVRRLIDDTAERDGEDIVQDVILNIFNMADVTIPIENLSAYIYRSLRNRVIDYLRKRRVDMVSLEDEVFDDSNLSISDLLHDTRYDTSRAIENKELLQWMFEAIESLNEDQKAVLMETELEGRSFRELSAEWGIPIGTLLARKSRALNRIKEALADRNK